MESEIPENEIKSVSEQLKEIFVEDQKFRILSDEEKKRRQSDPVYDQQKRAEQREQDRIHLKAVAILLAEHDITNPHDLALADFIYQHGETIEDYKMAYHLAQKSVEAGLDPQFSLVPQSYDRLQLALQRAKGISEEQLTQKYGTQARNNKEGSRYIYPLDNTATPEEIEKFKQLKPS